MPPIKKAIFGSKNKELEKKVDQILTQGESLHGKFNTFITQIEEMNKELFMLGEVAQKVDDIAKEVLHLKSQCRLILKNINDVENSITQESLNKLKSMAYHLTRLAKD